MSPLAAANAVFIVWAIFHLTMIIRFNYGYEQVEILPGNIGYVRIRYFTPTEWSEGTITSLFNFVANTDALIFDLRGNGGSMSDKVDKARQAAVQFMRTANPLDQFFLVSFNDRAELTSGFTSSVEELQTRMMFTASRGRTALLDAVYLGLSQMRGAHNAKRALLIISDGGDNHSRYNENDVKNFLKEADCQLYAIGIYDPIGIRSRTAEELNGPSLLSEMTNIGELPDIAAKIGMELRNQYVLGYKPSNAQRNGIWRKIKVKLKPPKGLPPLNVFAKTGYYAPNQ